MAAAPVLRLSADALQQAGLLKSRHHIPVPPCEVIPGLHRISFAPDVHRVHICAVSLSNTIVASTEHHRRLMPRLHNMLPVVTTAILLNPFETHGRPDTQSA